MSEEGGRSGLESARGLGFKSLLARPAGEGALFGFVDFAAAGNLHCQARGEVEDRADACLGLFSLSGTQACIKHV